VNSKNKYLFLMVLLLSSCSYFSEKTRKSLVWMGVFKSPDNQNINEILDDGRKVIFGQFNVFYDGINLTSFCSLAFNGMVDRRGGVLYGKHIGDGIIDLKNNKNYLSIIVCVKNKYTKNFTYYLKEDLFTLDKSVSYWGVIDIHFSSNKKNDEYRADISKNYRSPWIEKLNYTHPADVKKTMEERYKLRSQGDVRIIKEVSKNSSND